MRGVLMIAVLLRFMDSFMIYTEPFVLTGGGPGDATTFLSQYLTQKAVGQFDLGPAAAFSLINFLIIRDRKSVVEGKRVAVRVNLGCRRIIKKKKNNQKKD